MIRNIAIGALAVTTVAGAVWGYQSSQRALILDVLMGEKNREIATLQADKAKVEEVLAATQNELNVFQQAEAAKNSATVSDEDQETFGKRCKEWIAKEFGDKDRPAYVELLTEINDAWTKDGMLVFEIGTPSSRGNSQSLYLCIVDKEKGSMFKPSAFDTQNWRRNH